MIKLLSFLSGPSGKTSHMRVMSTFIVVAIVGTWSWVSVRKQALQPLDPEHAGLVVAALGIKAYQRTTEAKESKENAA